MVVHLQNSSFSIPITANTRHDGERWRRNLGPNCGTTTSGISWLEYLDERSVIPIVGPDLLQVDTGGETVLLEHYVTRCLAGQTELAVRRQI